MLLMELQNANAGGHMQNMLQSIMLEVLVSAFEHMIKGILKDTTLNENTGDRLWWFQVCTDVAYFQVAPANDSIRSSQVDTRYHLDLCSRIVFTNGSQDPWRHASKKISSPDMPSFVMSCHNCGHGTDMRGCPQSPFNIEGNARNCGSPDAVEKVRHQIIEKMDLWLSECHASDV
ncbi:hypothetical protein NC652_018521 [Populus alba x Populus x berolinensis]|nr:hypothetical protein NC652_018521 [Populus alba x Populus x berolinensis]